MPLWPWTSGQKVRFADLQLEFAHASAMQRCKLISVYLQALVPRLWATTRKPFSMACFLKPEMQELSRRRINNDLQSVHTCSPPAIRCGIP